MATKDILREGWYWALVSSAESSAATTEWRKLFKGRVFLRATSGEPPAEFLNIEVTAPVPVDYVLLPKFHKSKPGTTYDDVVQKPDPPKDVEPWTLFKVISVVGITAGAIVAVVSLSKMLQEREKRLLVEAEQGVPDEP